MSVEMIVDSLLDHPQVKALVVDRWALGRLPEGEYPSIVYLFPNTIDRPNLANHRQATPQRQDARCQVNLYAVERSGVIALRGAVHAALGNKFQVQVAGHLVISCMRVLQGPIYRDDEVGVWTQSIDYLLRFY